MKLSVSLPDDDVAVLDAYIARQGLTSRSAAVQEAIQLLRDAALEGQYDEAYGDWEASGEAAVWDGTAGDGIGDDPEAARWSEQYRAWQGTQQGGTRAAG